MSPSTPSPAPSSAFEDARARSLPGEDGSLSFYEQLAAQVIAMGHSALANVEPAKDVVLKEERGAVLFQDRETLSTEYVIVGEVAGVEDGTALGAAGGSRRNIDNKTIVRQKLALRDGSLSTNGMYCLTNNQRAFMEEAHALPTSADAPASKARVYTTEPLRLSCVARTRWEKSRPGTGEPARDVLLLTFPPMYRDLNKGGNEGTNIASAARGRAARNVRATVTAADIGERGGDVKMEGADDNEDTDDCKVGSLYMPDLLPDHNQAEIHHTASVRVEQHDVRDVEGNLIKPWDMPDKLRPGTFVKAMVQPTCWIYRTTDKINKIYALVVKSVRVLDESDEDVQVQPTISGQAVPTSASPAAPSTAQKRPASSVASSFDALESPSPKKRRST